MPLMGSLYVGQSGLQTGQNALNTTAHNLANAGTTGYVRQQVSQADRRYNTISWNNRAVSNQQVGLGTYYSKVRQVRDYFLDQSYRKEASRSSYYETSATALTNVEDLLGELEGESFSAALTDLWTSIEELSKNPAASIGQGVLVHKAYAFIERAKAVNKDLNDYQDNLNLQVKTKVDQINDYGEKLKLLNDQIRKIETGGTESPNDLRDARNQILDELASLVDISYSEDIDGSVSVQIEGVDFVKRDVVYEIGLQQDDETGFYTPFWKQNATYTEAANGVRIYDITNAKVFNIEQQISSDLGTDRGGLKSAIFARGNKRGNFTDLQEGNYDKSISNSIMVNVQAEFDGMIHSITTKLNQVIKEAADRATASNPASTYLRDSEGNPYQLFTKIATAGYDKDKAGTPGYDDDGYMQELTDDPNRTETYYTVSNLQINAELLKEPSKLDMLTTEGEDFGLAGALKDAFEEDIYYLNPNVKSPCNFTEYYSSLVSQVGNSGMVARSQWSNQEATTVSFANKREEVIGVSTDEELSNMIKFQNAYNASSRYINVINEMLEHILTTLGR